MHLWLQTGDNTASEGEASSVHSTIIEESVNIQLVEETQLATQGTQLTDSSEERQLTASQDDEMPDSVKRSSQELTNEEAEITRLIDHLGELST